MHTGVPRTPRSLFADVLSMVQRDHCHPSVVDRALGRARASRIAI